MKAKLDIRSNLKNALLNEKKVLMWSYDLSKGDLEVPDKIIVEKYLQFGNKREWSLLNSAFDLDFIKEVWINNLVYCGLYEAKQRSIARSFFNIRRPAEYLKKLRKAHIERSIAECN